MPQRDEIYIRHSGHSENVLDQVHRRSRILCLLFLPCLRARPTERGCETSSLAWPQRSPLVFFPWCVQVLLRGVRGPAGGRRLGGGSHQRRPLELLHVRTPQHLRVTAAAGRLAQQAPALLRQQPRAGLCECLQSTPFHSSVTPLCL